MLLIDLSEKEYLRLADLEKDLEDFGCSCIVSDILEKNVSTNLDNITLASGKLTKDRVKLMHEYLVSGEKEIKEGQTTYFKSVGMGLFDVCIAQKLYEVAKEK